MTFSASSAATCRSWNNYIADDILLDAFDVDHIDLVALLWLTSLSGSGKSTIAQHLDARLFAAGMHSYVLDGDNIRHGLNVDLGFSAADRRENIRRVDQVPRLFVDAGFIVSAAFISPSLADRDIIRNLFEPAEFENPKVWSKRSFLAGCPLNCSYK